MEYGSTVLGAVLGRTEEIQGEIVRTTIQPHKIINKEQSQLSLPQSLLKLQVNQGLHKWASDQEIVEGLQ